MKLERFQGFTLEIEADSQIRQGSTSIAVYRFFDDRWYDPHNTIVSDEILIKNLGASIRRKTHWRHKSDTNSYFPIVELDAVVVVQFSKPATINTRARYVEHFERCLRNSKNAFDATHDPLTGLLNRGGFEEKLLSALNEVAIAESNRTKEAASALQQPSILGLLAIDIDHFKQINDSYGHQYGDLVLQSFARRLEKISDTLMAKLPEPISLTVGRPGGEEFSVLAERANSISQLVELSEEVRRAVEKEVLPSDEEWRQLTGNRDADVSLPNITERQVTISIGVAAATDISSSGTVRQKVNSLIHHSDTALYRAKVGGRNRVRSFSEILARHGRVLEHHANTGVVTIDIGALVGVAIGQEFSVYHPDFSGGVPFMYRDGRTEKRLGDYPKIPCGRLVVFNVQNEISFCKVAHKDCVENFLAGSVLEAIPIGSLSHLLAFESQFAASTPDLTPAEKIPEIISSLVKDKEKPFVAVFRVKDAVEVSKKRGQVFINQCLTKMYQAIRGNFRFESHLSQIQPSVLAVVCRVFDSSENALQNVKKVIDALHEDFHGQGKFVAGLFDPNKLDTRYGSKLDLMFALDFARYAASNEENVSDTEILPFNIHVASNIVYAARRIGSPDSGLADYRKFVEHGVRNPNLENQAALCELEKSTGDFDSALAFINNAIEMDGAQPTYYANKGYIEYYRGNPKATVDAYKKCWEIDNNFVLDDVYVRSYALSLARVMLSENGRVEDLEYSLDYIDKAIDYSNRHKLTNSYTRLQSYKEKILNDARYSGAANK